MSEAYTAATAATVCYILGLEVLGWEGIVLETLAVCNLRAREETDETKGQCRQDILLLLPRGNIYTSESKNSTSLIKSGQQQRVHKAT